MDYVVGDAASVLVAALTKAERGRKVALYLPENGIGGGFSGALIKGRTLDFGLRVFELAYRPPEAEPSPALEHFDPAREWHKDYIRHIRDFITGIMGDNLRQLAPPQLLLNGRKAQCIFYDTDLSALSRLLSAEEQRTVREQTAALAAAPQPATFGARFQTSPSMYDMLDALKLEDVSRASHGAYLHEKLYAPLARKAMHPDRFPQGMENIPASFYAKFWFKVFYPENIAAALTPGSKALTLFRPLHYPKRGGFRAFIQALTAKALAHPNVERHTYKAVKTMAAEGGNCQIGFEGCADIAVPQKQLTLGLPSAALFRATGIACPQGHIDWGLSWVEADAKDVLEQIDILTIADADIPAFRISTGGDTAEQGKVLFTVEFGNTEVASPFAAAREALEKAGLLREGAALEEIHHFRGRSLSDYSFATFAAYQNAKAQFARLGFDEVAMTGGIHSLHAEALNDQLLQGLYYGQA